MSGRRLIAYVHVDGQVYGPDGDVPASVAKQIGDHAWADGAGSGPSGEDQPSAVPGAPPPRSGRGSGVEAWLAFAETTGVEVDDGASRDDVIAACEQAGVITPEA